MGYNSGNRLRQGLGYLLYTLVVFGGLLWLLFPAAKVQQLAIGYLGGVLPGTQWRVGGVAWQLPLTLSMESVNGYLASDPVTPVLQVDKMELWPGLLASLRDRTLWIQYKLWAGKGQVEGRLQYLGPDNGYRLNGTARSLQLVGFPVIAQLLERKVQGEVHAAFEMERGLKDGQHWRWKAQLAVDQGQLALVRPLLNHTVLPFSQITMLLLGEGKSISVEQGKMLSPLGKGWFNGSIRLENRLPLSELDLRGGLQPEPLFFQGVESTAALQAIRTQLKDTPLPVRISGSVLHPGIHFEDLTMQIYALEQERR
jgi:type II secretion system protein N